MTEDERYAIVTMRADARAQRRFRSALISAEKNEGQWDVTKMALYYEAENLLERLRIGPCESWCPANSGGDHEHDYHPCRFCGVVPPMSEYGVRYTCECEAGR